MRNALLFTLLLLSVTMVLSGGTVVGSPDGGNCYPFSCFATDGGTTYQQVYSSTAFSGPILISTLTFYQNLSGPMDDATYTIDLSTTSSNVGDSFPLTAGADDQIFGTFPVSGDMPVELTFSGTPFPYDPGNGNLLMQVTVDSVNSTNPCGDSYCSFFLADYTEAVTSRAWNSSFYGPNSQDGALVTGFNVVDPTPEPASFGMLACGLGAILALLRRRKA
jgi:hypothetical protein